MTMTSTKAPEAEVYELSHAEKRGDQVTARVAPVFAAVVPIFKHSVLLVEAVNDLLRECRMSNGCIVLVNDGCPFPETHEACEIFSTSYPEIIDYIRVPNGGLSSARNRGVKQALARYPSVEKLYFMDADNRLRPGAIRRASELLDSSGAGHTRTS